MTSKHEWKRDEEGKFYLEDENGTRFTREDVQRARKVSRLAIMVPPDFDNVANILPEQAHYGCLGEMSMRWDQWVVVELTCSHGTYRGTSDFLNYTEAIMRASVKFSEAHKDIDGEEPE